MSDFIKQIISGACIGSDMGGLYAAEAVGIPTGGWNWTGDRRNSWLSERFGIKPMAEHPYMDNDRTSANVLEAHGTIHMASDRETVTDWPIAKFRKPSIRVQMKNHGRWYVNAEPDDVRGWIVGLWDVCEREPLILNIAGDAQTEMEPVVKDFLVEVLTPLWKSATISSS